MTTGKDALDDESGGGGERATPKRTSISSQVSSSSLRSSDPLVGTVINGKFHIHKAIARGGMGRIYYGTQAPLDRPVALKIVKADSINEGESQFLKRFLLEASILAKLQHPNVVTLFDYGRIEGAPVEMYFIAMEFLNGETLSERLRVQGQLATYEMLTLFRQIARGLREAHSRGVVHRDLKPSNIVIVPEADGGEIVKLVDFGIGKDNDNKKDDEDALTRDGILVGTPKYMAPEQFDGQSSPSSDVYALGIIAYQCLAGSLPYSGNTLGEMMVAKLQHPVRPLREVNPISDVTPNVERLIYQMLARHPEQRPSLEDVFRHLALCEEEVFGTSGPFLGSGSGSHSRPHLGFPNSSQPIPVVNVLSPDQEGMFGGSTARFESPELATVVAPPLPSSGSGGVGAVMATPAITMTPRPMSASSFPSGMTPQKSSGLPVPLLLALVFAFGTIAIAGSWFAITKSGMLRSPQASSSPASSQATATTSTPSFDKDKNEKKETTSFVLHLDSIPSGAAVTEDGNTLGVTPIMLKIERDSVMGGPRTFQIKKEGFAPTVLAQGAASEPSVETVVPLVADPTHASKAGAAPGNANANANATASAAKPHPAAPNTMQGESDIRLKR